MRIARMQLPAPDGPEVRIVVAFRREPGRWVDVRRAARLNFERKGATPMAAQRLAQALVPSSLSAALENGEAFLEALARAAEDTSGEAIAPEGRLVAPLDPSLYRDFLSFEVHFTNAARLHNHGVAPVLYEMPVGYMGNAHAFIGPDEEVPWPFYAKEKMDYELELGIVVGRGGRNLRPEEATGHILGLTILNDFSARDIQLREMQGRLGPAKGKHFCNAVGPVIVTLDELPSRDLQMTARVNGEVWSSGNSGSMLWSLEELVAWASAGEPLPAGALLGSGTVGWGCGMELQRYLNPGDVVELEVEGIGVLRNRLGRPPAEGWLPSPKTPHLEV
ncbi:MULTISPECIES: fumarylacetoacetate hydrolase family protein [unclassified Meiothermus]|uniref:fumarylacetoacetate hydrolase family protein n=1 Tax=unclassified Meiothermus TaxID=370471 RepID=UPI000D7CBF2E|nr:MULTISPECIES: fumarylacetoacetate hydrolase family protein [unclassified Meiothermus]PZA07700.1 fumarylacetoacetate hydrolase family protein [Meiothermus sp. Pnk-1]RYM34487.1 fumarylacetoacetate hydrolase family protein [Meiothermus sp. PNK-Is4]